MLRVFLIARPQSFFPDSTNSVLVDNGSKHGSRQLDSTGSTGFGGIRNVTPTQRLSASLLGVCGAVIAYVSIWWMGKRAHPIISVYYFAAWTAFMSAIAL